MRTDRQTAPARRRERRRRAEQKEVWEQMEVLTRVLTGQGGWGGRDQTCHILIWNQCPREGFRLSSCFVQTISFLDSCQGERVLEKSCPCSERAGLGLGPQPGSAHTFPLLCSTLRLTLGATLSCRGRVWRKRERETEREKERKKESANALDAWTWAAFASGLLFPLWPCFLGEKTSGVSCIVSAQ
jgi:hypothetical protein